jgi:hypothetical protein
MFSAGQYRDKAIEYARRAATAATTDAVREFRQLERSFHDLAENAEWMARNAAKTLHAGDEDRDEDARGAYSPFPGRGQHAGKQESSAQTSVRFCAAAGATDATDDAARSRSAPSQSQQ